MNITREQAFEILEIEVGAADTVVLRLARRPVLFKVYKAVWLTCAGD